MNYYPQECAHRFPVPLYENEGKKTEKFILTVSPDQLKAVLTLTGDAITQAVSYIITPILTQDNARE